MKCTRIRGRLECSNSVLVSISIQYEISIFYKLGDVITLSKCPQQVPVFSTCCFHPKPIDCLGFLFTFVPTANITHATLVISGELASRLQMLRQSWLKFSCTFSNQIGYHLPTKNQ